jgi:hypothetical protein
METLWIHNVTPKLWCFAALEKSEFVFIMSLLRNLSSWQFRSPLFDLFRLVPSFVEVDIEMRSFMMDSLRTISWRFGRVLTMVKP